jgi:crotonobetainyl-CoA:carnitine CoA-transferase CaiB-like acyl-CoA transferase
MSELAMRPDGSLTDPGPALDQGQFGLSPGRRIARCADGWIALVGPDLAAPTDDELAGLDGSAALAMLTRRGFQAVPVREDAGRAFLFDLDKIAHGLVARYQHPIYGELRHPGAFWTMPDAALQLDRAPPALDQHGPDILAELGFDQSEIDDLARQGVINISAVAQGA